jgi:RHS repeat-associated protein
MWQTVMADVGAFHISDENSISGFTQKYRSQAQADLATGAFTYQYTIDAPAGRNGVSPSVSLVYSNQNTANDSAVGYGWSLSIPYIERVNKHGVSDLYTQNDFNSSSVGELASTSANTYGAKVDNGENNSFVFNNNIWTVKDKQGTTYVYGGTQQSQQNDPNNVTQVSKWMLESVTDSNGNNITYNYYKSEGQIYPSTILYTGNGSNVGKYSVSFIRETRPDTTTSYSAGYLSKTTERIKEIQVLNSDSLIQKYQFAYTTGNNGYRSLLNSIIKSTVGSDSSIITLPATTFSYTQNTLSLENSSSWAEPAFRPALHYATTDDNSEIKFSDLNGDAYPDMMVSLRDDRWVSFPNGSSIPRPSVKGTWLNDTKTNWVGGSSEMLPPIPFIKPEVEPCSQGMTWTTDMGSLVMDVNGDYLPDIVQNLLPTQGPGINNNFASATSAYINNQGENWQSNSDFIPQVPITARCQGSAIGNVGNLNGDGFLDIFTNGQVQYGTGSGFLNPQGTPSPIYFSLFSMMGDINGDGLDDSLSSYFGSYEGEKSDTSINTGTSAWALTTNWVSPLIFYSMSSMYPDNYVRLIDINGDGLLDLVQLHQPLGEMRTYLNTGNGWAERSDWKVPSMGNYTKYFDINADGLVDFYGKDFVRLNKGTIPDKLTTITDSKGVQTSVTYKQSSQYRDGSENILNPKLPFIVQTVEKIITTEPVSGLQSTISHTYAGGSFYYGGPFDRKFAGFGKVTTNENNQSVTTTYYHQGNSDDVATGEQGDDYAKIGKVYRTEISDVAGNIYKTELTKWKTDTLGTGRYLVTPERTTSLDFDGNATHKDTAQNFVYDIATGNLTQKTSWGEVTADPLTGSFTDVGSDKTISDMSYAVSSTNPNISLPSRELVTDQSSATVKDTKWYYDQLSFGQANKGNQSKEEKLKSGSTYVSTQKTYDGFGNVLTSTDPRGNTTSYIYDQYNLFVATETNSLLQTKNYLYDYGVGKAKQVTDENGFVYTTRYDGLGRPLEEKQPDATAPTTFVTKATYEYTDTVGNRSVKKKTYLDSSNGVDEYAYFDGLDRVIQKRKEMEGTDVFSVSDSVYNNRGLLQKESLPYFSNGSARTSATSNNALYSNYTYDTLKRVTQLQNAVGTTANSYDDWKVTTTDAKGKQKSLTKDAQGNLVRVDENNLGSTYTTQYENNQLGSLTKITDAEGNVRNFTYDNLGERLSAEDLHATADSVFGTWHYSYDNAGNLAQSVDPKNQTINHSYDALNRNATEDYVGQSGVETTYSYDTCANGKTKLCSVNTAAAATAYLYDPLGRISKETKTIDSTNFVTLYTYDQQGNQTLITYPDNSQVRSFYNKGGLLYTVQKKESGESSFTDIISNFDYSPTGQISKKTFGNGDISTYTYDQNELYRLKNTLTVASSTMPIASVPTVPPAAPSGTIKVLVVGGGGGGFSARNNSNNNSGTIVGGGGAGGVVYNNVFTITSDKTYAVTVGNGGYGVTGGNSVFDTLVAYGGGFGNSGVGGNGGSGGGLGGNGTTNQGNDGIGGGGGGAGATGNGYNGGVGIVNPIVGSTAGQSVYGTYYVGGGGAGRVGSGNGTAGGYGGGGNANGVGGWGTDATNGMANTGGGAGSAVHDYENGNPRSTIGGSGVVVIAFRKNGLDGLSIASTGGVVTTVADYQIHTFLSSGTFNPVYDNESVPIAPPITLAASSTVGVLVVGGGGGAVSSYRLGNGGGGAGGVVYNSAVALTAQTYSVTIGDGGIGGNVNGGNSLFSTLTALGGGGGGIGNGAYGTNGSDGGSGGGSADPDFNGGMGASGQGNNGGWAYWSDSSGGGGGGAGAVGIAGSGGRGGNGGVGIVNPIVGSTAGQNILGIYYLAGGGAGGGAGIGGTGGSGGGANGGAGTAGAMTRGNSATANTGGGAGAGYRSSGTTNHTGGSGVVVICFHKDGSDGLSASSTGGIITTVGDYQIHTFLSSGVFAPAELASNIPVVLPPTQVSGPVNVQDLTYTYDALGNITSIVDISDTKTKKNVSYTYDDLSRLLSTTVSNSATSTSNYVQNFTYGPTGNILSGPLGAYSYAGNIGTNYANPHAATTIATSTLSYDQNGNLTNDGTLAYSWDYKDHMLSSANGTFTVSTYAYDRSGQRVKRTSLGTTTIYPNKLYEVTGTTTTKYIFAGDTLVATVENPSTGSGQASTSSYFIHADHLGGTNIVTDQGANVVETLDYYPYGQTRLDDKVGTFSEKRKYIGEYADQSGLSYLNARYYNGTSGKFISQDPVFWEVGMTSDGEAVLLNPQAQNSYAYANGNPVRFKDPSGRIAGVDDVIMFIVSYLFVPRTLQADPVYESEQYAQTSKQQPMIFFGMGTVEVGKGVQSSLPTFERVMKDVKNVEKPYVRPSGATTKAQREVVNKPGAVCVTCGKTDTKMAADHKDPLVIEYYTKGSNDLTKMHSTNSVQPQCLSCSSQQGGFLSNLSKQIKQALNF